MCNNFDEYMKRFPQICFQKRWQISDELNYRLGQCEAMVRTLMYLPLPPSVRSEMLKISLIKGAKATTAIEGNTLSEREVAAIQEGRSTIPESRRYLEKEVANVIDAFNLILNEVVERHSISEVTPDLIRSFHHQVGKELGEGFESVPGQFRSHEVVVGTYRAPEHQYVGELVRRMCAWLRGEFGFRREVRPSFREGVIEAIVAHIYLVWIHPFGDGNGRTARLLEFYLMLRSGVPNTCSHILSNFYNQTRSEYYGQLVKAGKTGDLTAFIEYAIGGLYDGIQDVLNVAQREQIKSCWRNYVYDVLDGQKKLSKAVRKRYSKLLTGLDVFSSYTQGEMLKASVEIASLYAGEKGPRTLSRDVKALMALQLLDFDAKDRYHVHFSSIVSQLPQVRSFGTEETSV